MLHTFSGPDGASPLGTLTLDSQGTLYGTTELGGSQNVGTVFKLDTSGMETVVHSFTNTPDGAYPMNFGGMALDQQGNLYGTTNQGGSGGGGTLFQIDSGGNESVLWSFVYPASAQPVSAPLLDAHSILYGTTEFGGQKKCEYLTCGTVYRAFKNHTGLHLTKPYGFKGKTDGGNPKSKPVEDAAGNIYGTTHAGGGAATIFKLSLVGGVWKETVFYTFPNVGLTGNLSSLVMDGSGNLYGTISSGTTGELYGSVFKVTPSGVGTTLYTFSGGSDGAYPGSEVAIDAQGNLYGTTENGGNLSCNAPNGCGTVFKLDPKGNLTVLHAFTGSDGSFPYGGLVLDGLGNVYGAAANGGLLSCTGYGGGAGCGVVFKIAP